jgi:hypothetical protein
MLYFHLVVWVFQNFGFQDLLIKYLAQSDYCYEWLIVASHLRPRVYYVSTRYISIINLKFRKFSGLSMLLYPISRKVYLSLKSWIGSILQYISFVKNPFVKIFFKLWESIYPQFSFFLFIWKRFYYFLKFPWTFSGRGGSTGMAARLTRTSTGASRVAQPPVPGSPGTAL